LADNIEDNYYNPFMRALPLIKQERQIEKANKEMNFKIKEHAAQVYNKNKKISVFSEQTNTDLTTKDNTKETNKTSVLSAQTVLN